jgi:CMP/dCMP kinase
MGIPGTRPGAKLLSVTGDLGSGKSTVASELEHRWGVKRYYAGGFFREIALQRGLTISEITNLAKYGPEVDYEVDAKFKTLADSGEDAIGEGRMAWHCLPQSFKIKLNVCPEIAAQRIFRDKMRKAEHVDDPAQILASIIARQSNDTSRYKEIYGVDIQNDNNFDLVIDTGNVSPIEVADLVDRLTSKFFSGESFEKQWISPKSMYPSKQARITGQGLELPEDEFDENPITVVDINRQYLLIDGHTRTSKALMANVPFIPVHSVGAHDQVPGKNMTGLEFYRTFLNETFSREWAEVHSFTYLLMPQKP